LPKTETHKDKQNTMKKTLFTALTTCFFITAYGQPPDTLITTFNSKVISEEKMVDFELTTKYYTIENNIANKSSSVYVSDNPTIMEYVQFALMLPSYFFIVHNGPAVKLEITLLQKKDGVVTTFSYVIVNPGTGKKLEVPSHIWGQISEGRVQELEKLKLDKTSKIMDQAKDKSYSFNGFSYTIQSYDQVKAELLALVKPIMSGMESAIGNKKK
jgi:hypothetical protein